MKRQVAVAYIGDVVKQFRLHTFDGAADARRFADKFAKSEGKEVACGKGCSQCCYQKMNSDMFHGAMIYGYLKTEELWTSKLEQRLLEADKEMSKLTHLEWMQQQKPCPFLKEESKGRGSCQIYKVRPVGCTHTFSFGPAEKCWEPEAGIQFQVTENVHSDTMKKYMELMAGVTAGLEPEFIDTGIRNFYTLPGSVLAARALMEGLPAPDVMCVPIDLLRERKGPNDFASEILDAEVLRRRGDDPSTVKPVLPYREEIKL